MEKTFFSRYHLQILAVGLFLLPFAIIGAIEAKNTNKNQVKDWLPRDHKPNRDYKAFRDRFQGDEFILASWEGCTLDLREPENWESYDQRLKMMVQKLQPVQGAESLFKEPITVVSTLDQIARESLPEVNGQPATAQNLDDNQIKRGLEGLKGWLIGPEPVKGQPDLRQTCLVLKLSEAGLANMRHAVDVVRQAANESNIPVQEMHMGGPPVDNEAIDMAGEERLLLLFGLSIFIGIAVSWYSLRSFWLVLLVVFIGVYSMCISLAIIYFTGQGVNAIVLTMPTLVYVATTSGAIHLSNYYRDTVRDGTPIESAPYDAVKHAMLPLCLATGTTAVGLMTLCYSRLMPIKMFGLYSAIGVCVSFLLLVLIMPAVLQFWPSRIATDTTGADGNSAGRGTGRSFWWRIGEFITHWHNLVTAGCLLLMLGVGWGISQAKTEVALMKFFSPDARLIKDYAWLEENLGPLVPMEVLVTIDKQSTLEDIPAGSTELNLLDRLRLIRRLQREIESLDTVGATMSSPTFIDLTPPTVGFGGRNVALDVLNRRLVDHLLTIKDGSHVSLDVDQFPHRAEVLSLSENGQMAEVKLMNGPSKGDTLRVPTKTLGAVVGDYLREEYVAETGQIRQQFRISARVRSKDVDYAKFIAELENKVNPVLDEYRVKGVAGIDVQYTGVMPLVYYAQHSLLNDLILGFFTDFALIVIVMMLVCRDWSAGPVLLLPATFPAIMIFGAFGWLGVPVDIGSVMAPAVALGVTVDDVVHFMLWFQRGVSQGMSRSQAVMLAYKGCARAMYQSWGVIGIGLSVYVLSPFVPTQKFGVLMVCLLTVALIGNLVLLPSLLAGPLGSVFAWGIRRKVLRAEAKAERREQQVAAAAASVARTDHIPEPHLRSEVARRSYGNH